MNLERPDILKRLVDKREKDDGVEKISVLICAYQAEKTLVKCVKSVLSQGIDNLEIVIVDDGSTDRTARIADLLKEQNQGIRVIHQVNGGIGCARNRAIEEATGEWLVFLDSDDTLFPNAIKRLIMAQRMTSADLVCSAHRVRWGKLSWKIGVKKIKELNENGKLKELLMDRKLKNYVWGKLFHRSLFEHIAFPEGMHFEDVAIMAELLLQSEKTVIIPEVTVNYTVGRKGSITHGLSLAVLKDYEEALKRQIKSIEEGHPELKRYCKIAMWKIKILMWIRWED